MNIDIKKTNPRAQTPQYATNGAGGFDLCATTSADIPPTFSATVDTGLAFEIPPGYAMLVMSRSGHGFKHGIRLSNCVGLIDSDFRGSVKVRMHNDGDTPFSVEEGDRIAQGIIVPVERVDFTVVEELGVTERGEGGFGSTGK